MRLKNTRITVQVGIAIGVVMILIAFLGVISINHTSSMYEQVSELYIHPFAVRQALGELKADILVIRLGMKELVLAGNEQEAAALTQGLDLYQADASKQLDILYTLYLGDLQDIDSLGSELTKWTSIRAETIRLVYDGKLVEAIARVSPGGVGDTQAEAVMGALETIDNFAEGKAAEFYQNAGQLKTSLSTQLAGILFIIMLVALGMFYYLFRSIREPLKQLTVATDEFRKGNMDSRSRYVYANEFGALSNSFNIMAETLQTETVRRDRTAKMAGIMLQTEELGVFCRQLLSSLMEYTGSQVGAIYLLNDAKTSFVLFESTGLCSNQGQPFSALSKEGEFGAVLVTKKVQRITDIPDDSAFIFPTVTTGIKPREIITIPIISDHEVAAIISLASIHNYSPSAIRLVDDIQELLLARMNGVLANTLNRKLSEKLSIQNHELEQNSKELAVQAEELKGHNIELEMQRQQLEQVNRHKSAFLSNMSHELRTPLNSVIALSGVLGRRLHGAIPEEEFSYIQVVERNGKQLLTLINEILNLSRIEAGKEEINLGKFAFNQLISVVKDTLEIQAKEKGIELVVVTAEDIPLVNSDFVKFQHILQNIIANAVKFTDKGKVEISARMVNAEIYISVKDTGIGIAADDLPYLFTEFWQAEKGNTRKYGGTGLGLAIAQKYARLLQGDITVESILGKGSTFTIRLPVATHQQVPTKHIDEQPEWPQPVNPATAMITEGKTILIVEDNTSAVIQFTDVLKGQGYQILIARNGKEALEQIEKKLPDAMILDLMMPEVDGFEVLRQIRQEEKTSRIPVLIVTAKFVTKDELAFLKHNHVHQLLQKGNISSNHLLAAVRNMLEAPTEMKTATATKRRLFQKTGKATILVVEDNADNMKTVKALLRDSYSVIEATDGQMGIDQANKFRPDLILLDITLPMKNGYQVLDEMRKDEVLGDTPILALTASAMPEERERIVAYGFDGYISKPIDIDMLEKSLRVGLYGNE